MSSSPVQRRMSNATSYIPPSAMDGLVNYYEAEEERIINHLSRKLEKLRIEKVNLENALEAESESHVNKLSRELTALRRQQQRQQNGHASGSPNDRDNAEIFIPHDPRFPSTDTMLEALRRENESLRTRVVDLERDYIRIKRLNEIYREELIDHRTAAGTSIENLIGLDATVDDDYLSYNSHRRTPSSGSPSSAILTLPPRSQRSTVQAMAVPLPRVTSTSTQIYPRHHHRDEICSTSSSLTHSPISSDSPYTFSPHSASHNPASYVSTATNMTTPPSSTSLQSNPPMPYPLPPPQLSYPSVPPPSLSSSLGSPIIPFHPASNTGTDAPDLNLNHRRNSTNRRRGSSSARIAETGSLRDISESRSRSRRQSVERTVTAAGSVGAPHPGLTRALSSSGSSSTPHPSTTTSPIPIRVPRDRSQEKTPGNG